MSLLQMSFAGAVMILAIIVIRALAITFLPKKTFLALWGIAVMRLLLPFSLPSVFSVYSLIGNHIPMTAPAKVQQAFEVLPPEISGQMATMPGGISNTASPISVWTIIWGIGALVCALVFAIAYWKCRQEFQTSLPVDNDFIKGWLSSHQLKREISIRQSSRFSVPLTYGVLRPVILTPTSTDWENTKALQYVFAHEYVHIRRFDSITKLVLITGLCVHWFNPLVWAMYVLANRDIELSCDEAVVRLFGENTKAAYARSLISMEETRSGLTPLCNNFNKNAIEERITAIMKMKKTSVFSLVLALFLVFGVTTAFATSAVAMANGDTSNIPSEQAAANHDDAALALENINAVPPSVTGNQDSDKTTIPEKYMDTDGALNYEHGEEQEDSSAPVSIANTTLISVRHDDERKHTSEEWAQILELIDEGKVFWED
ncbi:M56 family metallopeptidase [bacterium 1XD8-76]|nr:M56 family metallopeptidase [uncultured Acetatifactor sp.]RKJ42622.1 M56 family metallopeptidase [bacterium 1XD8-76]